MIDAVDMVFINLLRGAVQYHICDISQRMFITFKNGLNV